MPATTFRTVPATETTPNAATTEKDTSNLPKILQRTTTSVTTTEKTTSMLPKTTTSTTVETTTGNIFQDVC